MNCNNLQTTQGITMHELPRNQPAVRRKWIKFIQFKWADFLAALHQQFRKPHRILHGVCFEADTMFQYSFKILPDRLKLIRLYPCGAKYQFHLRSSSWPFCSDSPEWHSRHIVTWFGHHGNAFCTTENALFHVFITLRSQFHLHHRSQWALMEIVSKITPNLGLVL